MRFRDTTIEFPPRWVEAVAFDEALAGVNLLRLQKRRINFVFPVKCKIMVDAGARLLCLIDQLSVRDNRIFLDFQEGLNGTMGYLETMRFFEYLPEEVAVNPKMGVRRLAPKHKKSRVLVRFSRINPNRALSSLPTDLSQVLSQNLSIERARLLHTAAFTLFGELIGNICEHSSTDLDGYAALQVHHKGNKAKFVVSDSGKGLIETLRPSLVLRMPELSTMSANELVVETFRRGFSRFGEERGRGAGLKRCADLALKYGATVDVRLATSRVHLIAKAGTFQQGQAWCHDGLPLLEGTHICLDIELDT